MFDVKRFLEEYSIAAITEGKNTSGGWINICCPFCRDDGYHGGFNLSNGYYHCWKCGKHWTDEVVSVLLDISKYDAKDIIREFQEHEYIPMQKEQKWGQKSKLLLPKGSEDLGKRHRKYLRRRNFDPDELQRVWDIKGTSFIGPYKFRIIIPIIVQGKLVSYIARDITGNSPMRYKACQMEDEIIHHKHIVYGADLVKNRKGIIVEGATDVWRLGPGAVATMGTEYTKEQVKFIASVMDTTFILYDPEAVDAAKKLCLDLSGIIKHVEIIALSDAIEDPGAMSDEEAQYLKKCLIG